VTDTVVSGARFSPTAPAAGVAVTTRYGPDTEAGRRSRFWRAVWRTHFYAGVFALPFLVLFAVTGLVILYEQPIRDALQGDLRTVAPGDRWVSLDRQRAAVAQRYPRFEISAVTPAPEAGRATVFSGALASGAARDVFVDPHTGQVLGMATPGSGVTGLANRLHGFLNNDTVTVKLPSLPQALWGEGSAMVEVPVTEIALEIAAVWGLTLAVTGLYLWWPRKPGTGKARFVPRLSKPGRARWRDLHAAGGVMLAGLLVFFVLSGMPWSAYWGSGWSTTADRLTPNAKPPAWMWEGPASTVPTVGDLDRQGRRIPWAAQTDPIPASGRSGRPADGHGGHGGGATGAGTGPAAPASLDLVAQAAVAEGMLPGFTINLPVNDTSGDEPRYGAYAVMNPWPSRVHHQRGLYLDQFSARTLATSDTSTYGALQKATELGVQTHMGTQFGLASRIAMTAGALLILWSAATAVVMWWKRRPRGGAGLPRRPDDVRTPRGLWAAGGVLGLIYPLWGLSALAALAFDRWVIRRFGPTRRLFGMRRPPAAA
jgi:uncharacterized iron-regulated membrane protein